MQISGIFPNERFAQYPLTVIKLVIFFLMFRFIFLDKLSVTMGSKMKIQITLKDF